MREFEIPDEAWTAVDRADLWIPRSDLRAALAAAAPLILAAELDRWASILEVEAQRLIDSIDKADAAGLGAAGAHAALSRQAREMRAEIAELRTPAAVTPEPAGPRELSVWRIVAGKPGHRGNRFRENNGALEVLGGDGVNDWLPSRWRSLDELRADGYTLTEVPAVPPAEPGVGA